MRAGLAGKIAQGFIDSKLTPLLMIAFLAVGFYTSFLIPREEEPQIDVPIADIFFQYPGAGSSEVEARITQPIEKLISNIKGVEYVYSQSMEGQALLIVQFFVGDDVERSLVKLYNEIMKHMDRMPPGVSMPLVKSRSIDDVPALSLTLWSDEYDDYDLRRVAQELSTEIEKITDVSSVDIAGGRSREVRVELKRDKLSQFGLDILQISGMIQAANQRLITGEFTENDEAFVLEAGNFLKTADDVANLIVGSNGPQPVYLRDIAEVSDGPEQPIQYVSFGYGKASGIDVAGDFPAVTISVAKRRGADAMKLAEQIEHKVQALKSTLIPAAINVETTRNYGETASHKVSELLLHLIGSIIAVTIVVALSMGWRGGLVVFLSVPVTFALTLFVYYLFGYTLNRITLFALVFVTGIVVDDSIIVAENMHRHFKMRKLPFYQAAIASLDEVGNPTILATFTVIASVLPMAFVSGLMGPYMSPMPIGAAMAMMFSLIVALMITPFLAYRLLDKEELEEGHKKFKLEETGLFKAYHATIQPLLDSPKLRWGFIGGITFLLLMSMTLFYFKAIAVKMLPFDNKNEFQVVIDMPEGSTLEHTAAVTKELAAYIRKQDHVVDYQSYIGTAAPINFNGLVRHYDLRRGSNVADIQVNLVDKGERSAQSHDIAKAMRPGIQELAAQLGANVKVVEVPPGPPVMSTLVAEIYGPDAETQRETAQQVMEIFRTTEGVVDVDWMMEDDHYEWQFDVDREKAMLAGISSSQISQTLATALAGGKVSYLSSETDQQPIPIRVRLAEAERSGVDELMKISMQSATGNLVSLGDLVKAKKVERDYSIYRKNQKRVIYVTGDVSGELESPVYAILDMSERLKEVNLPTGFSLAEYYTTQPFLEEDYTLKWDGEWHITYEVFRDLGAAFGVVLIIIYMLIIGWFQDFKAPLVMMVAIPLSLVGILVGHWIMGAFFTATSMIGMIALAGIMVRNSVLLIDFINLRLDAGVTLQQAVIEAGAVRTTPILLTAGTVVIGAFVILFDPIFQGLAISLMGGSIASTALTLVIVPLVYYMVKKRDMPADLIAAPLPGNGRLDEEEPELEEVN